MASKDDPPVSRPLEEFLLPRRESFPASPFSVSFPRPPLSESTPTAPPRQSLPPPPWRTSSPSPPISLPRGPAPSLTTIVAGTTEKSVLTVTSCEVSLPRCSGRLRAGRRLRRRERPESDEVGMTPMPTTTLRPRLPVSSSSDSTAIGGMTHQVDLPRGHRSPQRIEGDPDASVSSRERTRSTGRCWYRIHRIPRRRRIQRSRCHGAFRAPADPANTPARATGDDGA